MVVTPHRTNSLEVLEPVDYCFGTNANLSPDDRLLTIDLYPPIHKFNQTRQWHTRTGKERIAPDTSISLAHTTTPSFSV
uniref:Uncharacterized protein n=1 Tax=Octopus bimaculoides TaxID=37653 RepID=A0A0L8GDG9_OCTBM